MTKGRRPRLRPRPALLLPALLYAVAASGCGQWGSATPPEAAPARIPLGPGAPVRVASGAEVQALAAGSWRRHVAVAWLSNGPAVHVAVSRDAGATFDAPRDLAIDAASRARAGAPASVRVAVTAPENHDASPEDDYRVWVRVAWPDDVRAWRSTNGGRSYSAFAEAVPAGILDQQWQTESGPDGVRVSPPAALRAAGSRVVEGPPGASGEPSAVLDEHGALALAWFERPEGVAKPDLVLRRFWADWSSPSSGVKPFDAPIVVARAIVQGSPTAVVDVPGGIVVAWRGRDGEASTVDVRRVGLDMTCTSEQAGASAGPAHQPAR